MTMFFKMSLIMDLNTSLPPPQHHAQRHLYFVNPNRLVVASFIQCNASCQVYPQLVVLGGPLCSMYVAIQFSYVPIEINEHHCLKYFSSTHMTQILLDLN